MKISVGLAAGVFWALDTVILGIALSQSCFTNSAQAIVLAPFISTFLHDLCSCILMFLYTGLKQRLGQVARAFISRNGRVLVIGAILGGPVGMTGYVLAIRFLGASYTAMFTALFPALGALASRLFLGEELKKIQVIGMAMSALGLLLLGTSVHMEVPENLPAGIFCAALCIVGWVAEVIICAYGMKDSDLDNELVLTIRQSVSMLVQALIIMNVLSAYPFIIHRLSVDVIKWTAIAAVCGTVSYLCYYRTIHTLGAAKAMALNVTYSAWAIVFEAILSAGRPGAEKVSCGLLLLAGAFLTALAPQLKNKKEEEYGISGD